MRRSKSSAPFEFSLTTRALFAFGGILLAFGELEVWRSAFFEFVFAHFQDGVVLEFLFDAFFQGHEGELEDLHALDHSGRQELTHSHFLAHGWRLR